MGGSSVKVEVTRLPSHQVIPFRHIVDAIRVRKEYYLTASQVTTARYLQSGDNRVYHQVTVRVPSTNTGGTIFYVTTTDHLPSTSSMPFQAGDSQTFTDVSPNEIGVISSASSSDVIWFICEGVPPYTDLASPGPLTEPAKTTGLRQPGPQPLQPPVGAMA